MDLANVLLTVILSVIALAAILLRGFGWALDNWAIKRGLIRPGGETADNWPNGWHSLPDTLEGLYLEIQKNHDAGDG